MSHHKKTLEERIARSHEILKENLNTVRAGRANPALLDKIQVSYYGVPTPLKALANISVPEPRTLMISPFDASSISNIEHAINESNLGINPSNDGKIIRLVIPQLSEERRKELIKSVKAYGEEAKVAIRNVRRDINEHIKKSEKDGELTEDDVKKALDETQKIVDKAIKTVDEIVEHKNKEVMEV